jgi:hypothetical protein
MMFWLASVASKKRSRAANSRICRAPASRSSWTTIRSCPKSCASHDIAALERLIADGDVDAAAHAKAVRKLALLRTRIEHGYYAKAIARLAR